MDHLAAAGLSIAAVGSGLLADTQFVVEESCGEGTDSQTPPRLGPYRGRGSHTELHTGLQPRVTIARRPWPTPDRRWADPIPRHAHDRRSVEVPVAILRVI